jgi:hypothetical protein
LDRDDDTKKASRASDFAAFVRATNATTSRVSAAAWSGNPQGLPTTGCDDASVSPAACSSRSGIFPLSAARDNGGKISDLP